MCFSLGSFQNAEVVGTVNPWGKEKSSDMFRKVRNRTAFPSTGAPQGGQGTASRKANDSKITLLCFAKDDTSQGRVVVQTSTGRYQPKV